MINYTGIFDMPTLVLKENLLGSNFWALNQFCFGPNTLMVLNLEYERVPCWWECLYRSPKTNQRGKKTSFALN